jgi:hypothetical protein
MTAPLGTIDPIRTLVPNFPVTRPRATQTVPGHPSSGTEGEAMTQLDRTVWTAPVRNLVWVAAQFGHR